MSQKPRTFLFLLEVLAFFFVASLGANGQQIVPFAEPDDGRGPLLDGRTPLSGGINQAKFLDMYIFRICSDDGSCDPILDSILAAAAPPRSVPVRVLLEPCPGLGARACENAGGSTPGARTACQKLAQGGVAVKWANPGDADLTITKQHAKTILIDPNDPVNRKAFVMTLNLLPAHFSTRRDYGVLTNDAGIIDNLSRVFAFDWGTDNPLTEVGCLVAPARTGQGLRDVLPTDPLVISPDVNSATLVTFAREQILGLIRRATSSLKLHMQRIDPNDSDIVPELQAAIGRGVNVQALLDPNVAGNPTVAATLNAEPPATDRALLQTCLAAPSGPIAGRPHAKMIIVDGRELYVGSHNLTATSLDDRREIGWIVTDGGTITRFQSIFDADWALAVSPPPSCP